MRSACGGGRRWKCHSTQNTPQQFKPAAPSLPHKPPPGSRGSEVVILSLPACGGVRLLRFRSTRTACDNSELPPRPSHPNRLPAVAGQGGVVAWANPRILRQAQGRLRAEDQSCLQVTGLIRGVRTSQLEIRAVTGQRHKALCRSCVTNPGSLMNFPRARVALPKQERAVKALSTGASQSRTPRY